MGDNNQFWGMLGFVTLGAILVGNQRPGWATFFMGLAAIIAVDSICTAIKERK